MLTTKSPLTGIYLMTISSGTLGHELVRSGYRALVVTGQADRPVYLSVRDNGVELVECPQHWELPTGAAQRLIAAEVGGDPAVAVIGPAGVHGVLYANVITGGERMRAFGRGGAGAVMGSKGLKAVAVQGSGRPAVADPEALRAAARAVGGAVKERPDWAARRRRVGTTTAMENLQKYGMLPTRNWQRGSTDAFQGMAPVTFTGQEAWQGETLPCAPLCPAPCARGYRIVSGEYAGRGGEGPDYETIYALGINCGLDRFDAVVAADRVCDELGMDTISAGVVLGFVMECRQRGLISADDLDGVDLHFGDHAGMLALLPRIGLRQGCGEWLADGVRRIAARVGGGSEDFAMHAKGLELGGWGCRGANGQALQYAVGSRGGCHHDLGIPAKLEWGSPQALAVEGKGRLVLGTAADRIAHDSAVICSFSDQYADLDRLAAMYAAVWGQPVTSDDLLLAGERILNLERLLNVREGVDRQADQLPARLLREPLPDGPRAGATVPLEELKTEFYGAAGWDIATGIPLPETLDRLGIDAEVRSWLGAGAASSGGARAMIVPLPYGRGMVEVTLPEGATVAYPREAPPAGDVAAEIRRAMSAPIGCPPLREIARGKGGAVVVVNDVTRPAPSGIMLELIAEELAAAGIGDDRIDVVVATGNHRGNTPDEIAAMLGPGAAKRFRVTNHDCQRSEDMAFVGDAGGFPVWVNRLVAEAPVKVLTGLITPHHVAGYSGGRKSILPGVAGLETISRHHSFPNRLYGPAMGILRGNPFHELAVAAARRVGVDFIVNVVKNWRGEVVQAVAGDLEAAHQAGVAVCEANWLLDLPRRYEVVVATPGGYPRDINLHQAQKAMSTAEQVVAPGGVIVLVAECRDGVGAFGGWLKSGSSPRAVIDRFMREGFTAEHSSKAFLCARALAEHPVVAACGGIPAAELESMFFLPAAGAQEAVDRALALAGPGAQVLVLPYAVDCVPRVAGEAA